MATVTKRKSTDWNNYWDNCDKNYLIWETLLYRRGCTPLQLQVKSSYQLVDLTLWLKLKM